MAVRSKDEIMETIKTVFGESSDDTTISFMEDISDTLNDYETRVSESGDWKAKYEENDAEWRKRYKDRFFGSVANDPIPEPEPEPEPDVKRTYEDLFTTE